MQRQNESMHEKYEYPIEVHVVHVSGAHGIARWQQRLAKLTHVSQKLTQNRGLVCAFFGSVSKEKPK